MLPHLHAATVYVAPIATGAGTRTKLLEAMAAGLAIVTTRVGIEGIDAIDGQQVLLADPPGAFTTAVLRLLADPAERRRLGAAARRLMEERYDWARCLAPLEVLYAELLPPKAS
jgi:glycosyltransferase involved in cell wall biosynthesis